MLSSMKPTTTSGKTSPKNMLEEVQLQAVPQISTKELINTEENYGGVQLFNVLRKKLPNCIPSYRNELQQKHVYWDEFNGILLPQRTATGWRIDLLRLLDILSFRYYWLHKPIKWKLYGDGREIGGRKTTFLALSILNDEAALHNVSFQSQMGIFPISMFYESDTRDNLEENLGFPDGDLNSEIVTAQKNGHIFYLCGDEMFLEHMLADQGEPGPTMDTGWNIYSNYSKNDWGDTHPTTKCRTDLNRSIDRIHPNAILQSIPTNRVVFCLLHGLARVTEKLINLEVQQVISSAHIAAQKNGIDSVVYIQERLRNLENNINIRGVRQGSFRIHMNKQNVPKDVKLNKTHAEAILADSRDVDYPHVLAGVTSERVISNTLHPLVKAKLKLKNSYTELELSKEIWGHFFNMHKLLNRDREPVLKDSGPKGSTQPADYKWGYNDDDIQNYILHAETFYQLFCLRFNFKFFTPYMMKYIDYGAVLMKELPCSLSRFQAEGEEHANYMHNCFYYQHTMRHGGQHSTDPVLSVLNNVFKRISYDIESDTSPEGINAGKAFEDYKIRCLSHTPQRQNKEKDIIHSTPRRPHHEDTQRHGLRNDNNPKEVPACNPLNVEEPAIQQPIFKGLTFILNGSIPKINGTKYAQGEFTSLIQEHGGRIRKRLPDKEVCSTKRFIILTGPVSCTNLTRLLRDAVRRSCAIVKYEYVISCISEVQCLLPCEQFEVDVKKLVPNIKVTQSLEQKHFAKRKRVISILKKARKSQILRATPPDKHARNAAVYYAHRRRREASSRRKLSFEESVQLYRTSFKEWHQLPQHEKVKVEAEWKKRSNEAVKKGTARRIRQDNLERHNALQSPAYKSLFSF